MTDITINGIPRRPASEGDTPLLWYLRDELGLTGTRFGCGSATWRSPANPEALLIGAFPRRKRGVNLAAAL
jgi:hypothetical protein